MRHLIYLSTFLVFLGLGPSLARATESGVLLGATLSPKFIGEYQDLTAAGVSPERVREGLAQAQDHFELAGARFNLHAPVPLRNRLEWPLEYAFYLEAEGAGVLSRPDPARAELNAARLFGGIFRNVFQGDISEDLSLETAVVFGAGSERRETFFDNGSTVARGTEKGITLLAGVDLKVQKQWRFDAGWRLGLTAGTEETAFRAVTKTTEGVVAGKLRSLAHDWQVRGDFLVESFNAHLIAGRHPYATRILPRTWNRIADEANYRELSSQWGIGLGYAVPVGPIVRIAASAGYYARAAGGELRLRVKDAADFRLSTYGVENSSEFRRQNRRTYTFAAAFDI
jgi:hypothetical protein